MNGLQIWLDAIVTPFADRTCRFTNLFCKSFTSFPFLNKDDFYTIQICHDAIIDYNLVQI